MEELILKALSEKWDAATGWTIWEEYVAVQKGVNPADAKSVHYKRFKSALMALEKRGHLEQSEPNRVLSRATWQLTSKGWEATADEGEPRDEDVALSDPYVKKRITADAPAPRPVWKELMSRHRAGELDIVFVSSKKTGGSGE